MSKETENIEEVAINKLKVKFNVMLFLFALVVVFALYICMSLLNLVDNNTLSIKDEVLYTKGIVVLDEEGKERVLIGAPIPKSKDRVRDDLEKVKKAWGDDFPEAYLDWYKDYNHENYGMLILDENGFDRLAVGDPTPDPNIGKRIGPATGIVINDEKGFERSGYGLLNVKGTNRMVLGLDRNNGTEGLSLFVNDEGNSGLIMSSETGKIFLGKTKEKNWFTNEYPFSGVLIQNDSLNTKYKFNVLSKE